MDKRSEATFIPALRFHILTPLYDRVVRVTTREKTCKERLLSQARIQAGQRVLDLGCGTGTLAALLMKKTPEAEVCGVDRDREVLLIAQAKLDRHGCAVALHQASSYALPYPDGYFDCVLSSLFFHHLSWEDKQRTAMEIGRVLRPGAQVHVADWGRPTGMFMRMAFFGVQLLDGVATTQDNVEGRLLEIFQDALFQDVSETGSISTAFGTLSFYSATRT